MATEEWIQKAIGSGKLYEELPPRVRTLLPQAEWKLKVKDYCMRRGLRWADSLAKTACAEQEYHEDVVRFFRQSMRVFPYHLEYVCQVLRITPFKYYIDQLFSVMREERSYDYIPNFTAADIVRVVGIGRNEFISIMNQCKAKKLLWRVNKAIVKEFLPTEPLPPNTMQPWWIAHVVNLTESEYQSLSPAELQVCRSIVASNGLAVGQLRQDVLKELHKRGLVYLEVPIQPTDHVSIPPLEGFVSNKDSESSGDKGDAEGLLYSIFVASTERADVAALAEVLAVDLAQLQQAVSIACRLGFGTRLESASESHQSASTNPFVLDLPEEEAHPSGEATSAADTAEVKAAEAAAKERSGGAVAVVVDAEVNSLLMAGALSPGLKRHSVSLFEGGRVTGADIIAELVRELHTSADAAKGFEGEMLRMAGYASALARTLQTVAAAAGGAPLELLRKESLTGLPPASAARVLAHSYLAVVPIAPLQPPQLPLSPLRPGPFNYGATVEAATPWLQLALYTTVREGPLSFVLPAGQRLWRLPPGLEECTHALLWPWAPLAVRAESVSVLHPAAFLLAHINEALIRTAVLVQPLHLPDGELRTVDVALPLAEASGTSLPAISPSDGAAVQVQCPGRLQEAVATLGLRHAPGHLRMLQVSSPVDQQAKPAPLPQSGIAAAEGSSGSQPPPDPFDGLLGDASALPPSTDGSASYNAEPPGSSAAVSDSQRVAWVPLQLQLGLPLAPPELNQAVCSNALAVKFLEAKGREAHRAGQALLQGHLSALIREYGACSGSQSSQIATASSISVDLPLQNLLFDGQDLWEVEMTDCLQGIGLLANTPEHGDAG